MVISKEQALDCFRSDDLVGLGMEADAVRRRLHPEGVVGYLLEAILDAGEAGRDAAADEAADAGATAFAIGGLPQEAGRYEQTIRALRQRFPSLWLSGLDPAEVLAQAEGSLARVPDVLARMQAAGLNSLATAAVGHGCSVEAWVAVHREAHRLSMPTTAAFLFGDASATQQTAEHLETVRRLQQETGGFTALVPVRFRSSQRELDEATAVESLKTLAIARMMVEEIPHLQVDRASHSLKVLQMALRFGGDDAGPVAPERGAEEELRHVIRDAGFRPVARDAAFRMVFLF